MAVVRNINKIVFDGVEPKKIVYNNVDLNLVKVNMSGTSNKWAFVKEFTLSLNQGSNTTVTVTRTSSPYKETWTGIVGTNDIIYYGDVITITYSVSSGYAIQTHTINGTTFNSGDSITVTSNITIETSAIASASWHTVWSGYKTFYGTGTLSGITLVSSSYPTRVSGYGTETWSEGEQSQDHYFYNQNLPLDFVCGINGITAFTLIVNGTSIYVSQFYSEDGGTPELSYGSGTLTKVEQYY